MYLSPVPVLRRFRQRMGLRQVSWTTLCCFLQRREVARHLGPRDGTAFSWIPIHLFCRATLSLRVSHTEKNTGRVFLACKTHQYRFYQWVNEPWSSRLDLWTQVHNKTLEATRVDLAVAYKFARN